MLRCLVLSLWVLCVSLPASSLPSSEPSEEPPRIVLLGDSITAGMVSGGPAPAFADLLIERMEGEARVEVLGCGGSTSRYWHPSLGGWSCAGSRVQPNLFQGLVTPLLPARLVVVLLGTNDARGYFAHGPVSGLAYGENLEALNAGLLEAGAQQVMLVVPPPIPSGGSTVAERLDSYRRTISELCRERVLCGPDLFAELGREHFAEGDAHPNGRGHERIAALLEPEIRRVIPELIGTRWAALAFGLFVGSRQARAHREARSRR